MEKRGAVIYARVSTEEQAKNNSLASQERECLDYSQRVALEALAVFVDRESAKTDDREQLKKMLAYCAANRRRVAAVIVWKVDRLAENDLKPWQGEDVVCAEGRRGVRGLDGGRAGLVSAPTRTAGTAVVCVDESPPVDR